MKYILALCLIPLTFLLGEETFPSEISIDAEGKKYDLQLTGVSTRRKFGIKVYDVAHYLEKGASHGSGDKFEQILTDGKAKELYMKWVHAATPTQMKDGYLDSFKNSLSLSDHEKLLPKIQEYVGFFNERIKKGDVMVLRWLPGGHIQLLLNDKEMGRISDSAFAKALWSLWFGPKSVVNRDNLIKNLQPRNGS